MTIRIGPPPLPPENDGDTIARTVFAYVSQGATLTADHLKEIVDFRHPNGLGRTFAAMLILARQAVRTVSGEVVGINEPRIKEIERIVDVPREVRVEIPYRVKVEVLPDKRVTEITDQILMEIGAASLVARQEKRAFGTRDIRPIIERNLR